MKCVCRECGASKFRFIKGQNGEGLADILGTFTGSLIKSGTDQFQKVYNTVACERRRIFSLTGSAENNVCEP